MLQNLVCLELDRVQLGDPHEESCSFSSLERVILKGTEVTEKFLSSFRNAPLVTLEVILSRRHPGLSLPKIPSLESVHWDSGNGIDEFLKDNTHIRHLFLATKDTQEESIISMRTLEKLQLLIDRELAAGVAGRHS